MIVMLSIPVFGVINMLVAIISLILLLIDQASKIIVTKMLASTTSLTIIPGLFYLTYTHNKGAAWSILEGKRIFLILVALIVIGSIIYYIKKNKITQKSEILSFSLIIGGSLGNLVDRLLRGYVIDFLDFKIFDYNFPIFNLADTFIVLGVFLLFIISFRKDDSK